MTRVWTGILNDGRGILGRLYRRRRDSALWRPHRVLVVPPQLRNLTGEPLIEQVTRDLPPQHPIIHGTRSER